MQRSRVTLRRAAKHAALHVVPHADNGHVPHLLRGSYILGATAVAAAIFAGVVWGIPLAQRAGLTAAVYSSVLVDLTNDARQDADLPALTVNPVLERAALMKAQDMAAKGYFAHTSPEGKSPWHWLDLAGYKFIYAGENLAVHFDETRDVQKALLASPTHRANILDGRFTEIGIATFKGEYEGVRTTFVVESFGTPAQVAVAPAPAAAATPESPAASPAPAPPANVLGETAGEPAPAAEPVAPTQSTSVQPRPAPEPTPTPVKVIYEDPQLAIAENTSEDARPATVTQPAEPVSTWYERLFMNPGPAATTTYVILGLIVGFGTLAMAVHEVARHHTKHIAYGVTFVFLMLVLIGVGQFLSLFPSLSVS